MKQLKQKEGGVHFYRMRTAVGIVFPEKAAFDLDPDQ